VSVNCVILQPSYIPWRGYFHQIQKADVFVFYDDVQYDKQGWRNRNIIKTPHGPKWLTIPVHTKGVRSKGLRTMDIRICWNTEWNREHWHTVQTMYAMTPYFEQYAPMLEAHYARTPTYLADFTIDTTIAIARALGIEHTRFIRSSALHVDGGRTAELNSGAADWEN
jgi:hypothetical protein